MMYADELRVNSIVLAEMEEEAMETPQFYDEVNEAHKPIIITTADEAGNTITITYNK